MPMIGFLAPVSSVNQLSAMVDFSFPNDTALLNGAEPAQSGVS
jgi:hypothetical protein